jgi:hypothetical protein
VSMMASGNSLLEKNETMRRAWTTSGHVITHRHKADLRALTPKMQEQTKATHRVRTAMLTPATIRSSIKTLTGGSTGYATLRGKIVFRIAMRSFTGLGERVRTLTGLQAIVTL